MRVLIIGASGYNGRRVASQLVAHGHWVRGLVRDARRAPDGLNDITLGDVATGVGLIEALHDIDLAYYFVHSLDAADQDDRDLAAARNFVDAATATGLRRGVFFTTLAAPAGASAPRYQRNRLAVEHELLTGIEGMTAVRAGMVLADQSRGMRPYLQLVQHAPAIPLGPWRRNRIAVVDSDTTTKCLVHAGTSTGPLDRIVDIPSSAEPTHEHLFRSIMNTLGIRKPIVRLPWSTPTLDALLTSQFTDDSFHFSRHLASINRFDYLVDAARAASFAHITPLPLDTALQLAVTHRGAS
ncbi:NAD(P)H-binding protein [Rhodococcus qingshengii]|uniref:NAD(P)H-binding protein n=1 Tax=Rhodococcus qingshengii TaxID=334542 RepID=UPI0036DB18D2